MLFSKSLKSHRIFKRLAKALIRLRVCAGWSKALLVAATTLLEISCRGSIIIGPRRDKTCLRGFRQSGIQNQPPQLQRLARKLKFRMLQVYIWNFPISEQQRRWSDCADAQAGLRLCCSQNSEDRFSRVEAKIQPPHVISDNVVFWHN